MIKSSDTQGTCYVETKNLDGESNLKMKFADKTLQQTIPDDGSVSGVNGMIKCEHPNDQIYKFKGSYKIADVSTTSSLSQDNVLLRGSSLRNTNWIIGIVVYTGQETKIMKNSARLRYKKSRVELGVYKEILHIVVL